MKERGGDFLIFLEKEEKNELSSSHSFETKSSFKKIIIVKMNLHKIFILPHLDNICKS